ncbi:hypothetical protein [Enterobacter intestinihominis]|uniref:tail fiber/spike domain-containing protein n=1 Tax=Enterobacter intestinihominis TaxID=3133180 RepID=UPI003B2437B6
MATQPTQNAVPSESPRDLKFNAGKIDEFVTSMGWTYTDRFGVQHYTIEGMRWLAQQAISAFGYITLDSFEDGNTLTLPNQVLRLEATGEYYRWDGAFPKNVPAGSSPESTGGVGIGAWLSVGDASLRTDLSSPGGVNLVNDAQSKSELSSPTGSSVVGVGERTVLDNFNDIKHSGNYASIQEAINNSIPKSDLILSPGDYNEQVTTGNANIVGTGYGSVLRASAASAAVSVTQSVPHWQYRKLTDLKIIGPNVSGMSGIGLTYGDDIYSGRWNNESVAYQNLDVCILKPAGNIGNTYRDCSFQDSNYGYKALSATGMHAGADTFYGCHFQNIQTYCVYANGKGGSGVGAGVEGIAIRDCIMEASPGGGMYFIGNGVSPQHPILISHVWLERMSSAASVSVDGVDQKPRSLKLEDIPVCYAEYSYINNIELKRSNLIMNGCRIDSADAGSDFVIDNASYIISSNTYLYGSPGRNITISSIANQNAVLQTDNLSVVGGPIKGRLHRVTNGQVLASNAFSGAGPFPFSGTATVNAIATPGGTLSNTCAELDIPPGYTLIIQDGTASLSKDFVSVWGVSLQLISGDVNARFTGSMTAGDAYTKLGEMIHTYGVGYNAISGNVNLTLESVNGCKIRISDYFVAQFEKSQDAYEFANSRMSIE